MLLAVLRRQSVHRSKDLRAGPVAADVAPGVDAVSIGLFEERWQGKISTCW